MGQDFSFKEGYLRYSKLHNFLRSNHSFLDIFLTLFQFHIHKPDWALVIMKSKLRFDHDQYGYRDIIYLEDKDMYLTVNSEMDAFNRIDSYIANKRLPWKKKKPTIETLQEQNKKKIANLELHAKGKNDLNEKAYLKVWEQNFPSQAICLAYEAKLGMIAVGTDDGCIYWFTWDPETKMEEVKLVFLKEVHKKRVMNIWFDHKRQMVFSIGEDKYLRSYSTATKEPLTCKCDFKCLNSDSLKLQKLAKLS